MTPVGFTPLPTLLRRLDTRTLVLKKMRLAVVNLETGLFMSEVQWTPDIKHARTFPNTEIAADAASYQNVKNAAAVMVGDNHVSVGFIWLTNSHPN